MDPLDCGDPYINWNEENAEREEPEEDRCIYCESKNCPGDCAESEINDEYDEETERVLFVGDDDPPF